MGNSWRGIDATSSIILVPQAGGKQLQLFLPCVHSGSGSGDAPRAAAPVSTQLQLKTLSMRGILLAQPTQGH
eukprot:56717-Amphidinium_carterae.1